MVKVKTNSAKQTEETMSLYAKKEYSNKTIAPCIQCCGERRAHGCSDSKNCEEWREYALRRNADRKSREFNLIRVSRSLYLFHKI